MTAPLTDEQVAWIERRCSNEHFVLDHERAVAVAREVQAYRALRPDCPTCHGKGFTLHEGKGDGYCPDCTDGKMPLDKWVALLVETLAAARSDMEGWAAYASDYFTAKHNLAGDLASVDAVLKMVPKVAE